jgi:hypothetical protein
MTRRKHGIVTLSVEILHETPMAWMIENQKGVNVWVPKSLGDYKDGELQLPEWMAIEKELV